jgi:5'-nucleotidase
MNKLEGATDIQVALTHEGVKNDIRLAKEVKGIDAIVGGHDHVKPAEYCRDAEGVPVCQTPANGAYLGRIDLVIDNGHVVSSKEALIPIDKDIKPDNGLKEKLRPFLSAVEREMKEVLGAAVKDYPHQRGSATSPLGLLITTVIKDETGADIGFMNAGGIRQGLKKGEITRGEIEEILPFPNEVVVVEMRGAELKALLDRLEKAGKSAQLSGIAGADGLAPDKLYKVATSSFLSNGGDGCEALKKARLVKNTKIYIKDMVAGYIEREKKI